MYIENEKLAFDNTTIHNKNNHSSVKHRQTSMT